MYSARVLVILLYDNISGSDERHLGCFKDGPDRALPHLLTGSNLPPSRTVKACIEKAIELGYHYAGVQVQFVHSEIVFMLYHL